MINHIKIWLKNTIEQEIADKAISIIEAKSKEVLSMVANNAFIITEMKEDAKKEGLEKGSILARREDILDNLKELGEVSDEIVKIVNGRENIEILKKWVKFSARVESIEEFLDKINLQ